MTPHCVRNVDAPTEHLLDLLDDHPLLAAMFLSSYDDPETLPAIRRTFDGLDVEPGDTMNNTAISELAHTIERLDGAVTQARARKAERARRQMKSGNERLSRAANSSPEPYEKPPEEDIGRNDPCWCGSGKKHKRCHLRSGS